MHIIDNIIHADLHVLSSEIWHLTCESASIVNGARWHLVLADDVIGKCNTVIVFTKAGRLMDNTGAVLIRHISVHKYAEGSVLILYKGHPIRRCFLAWNEMRYTPSP
jgi:hypothetical protein